MRDLDLEEETQKELPIDRDTEETVTFLESMHAKKFRFRRGISHETYSIQPRGYVGYIPIGNDYHVYIKPKVEIRNIFRMLEYAYKVDLILSDGNIELESIDDIFERLAKILARKVIDRNQKGLYRGYIEKTKPSQKIRGRLQIRSSTLSILKGIPAPTCRYEENTPDLPENQILLWTLYKLRQFNFKREDVKRDVRLAYRELVDKVSLNNFVAEDCVNRFYNRLNIDYKPIHGICRFFLEHSGPAITPANHDFYPFLLNMPHLFQSFVAQYLAEKLVKYRVQPQYAAKLGTTGFEFIIDLVIKEKDSGEIKFVMDTKYERRKEPLLSEIQQIAAYAIRMKTTSGFLIYPSQVITSFNIPVGDITIKSLVFDLSQDVEKAGMAFIAEIESL